MRVLLAIVLPPLLVFAKFGPARVFYLNLLLTLLFYVPGVFHALWLTKR